MAMRDRNLVTAGIVAVVAAVCCAAPLLATAVVAAGLTAWLARAGNLLDTGVSGGPLAAASPAA